MGPPRLDRVQIPLAKLPRSMDGLRIATVSDIHIGPLRGREHTEQIVAAINRLDADLVAVVGDLVDGTVAELGEAAAPLRGLRSRYGSYFVTGNHEYYSGVEEWVAEVDRLGLRVLQNQRLEIAARGGVLDLAGVNDVSAAGTGVSAPADYAAALGDRDPSRPVVLLAHQPVAAVRGGEVRRRPATVRSHPRWSDRALQPAGRARNSRSCPGWARWTARRSTSPTAPASGGRRCGSARSRRSPSSSSARNSASHLRAWRRAQAWPVVAGCGVPPFSVVPPGGRPPFVADLHIHSKYSRACSRDLTLPNLGWWARRKGIGVLGTGDFTHPAWYDHLRETLRPAEPGLYRLAPEAERDIARRLPPRLASEAETDPVRFMLSVEISTIYKRDDRTRKVHHLIYLPDLDAVGRFNAALGRIGNLGSDGRPILGLDSRDLLEITLEASPDGYLVPAHIWTPWFSALGSKSGFDAIADCYADLAEHIFAVETGLSSDPEMNWRVGSLDRYRLVSNSDAHSPPALAREATVFASARDYFAHPGGAAHRRRAGRHDRVLPRGGQVPRGRPPAVRGELVARADPEGRRDAARSAASR